MIRSLLASADDGPDIISDPVDTGFLACRDAVDLGLSELDVEIFGPVAGDNSMIGDELVSSTIRTIRINATWL